jgi:16S rRNA (guanine527-N7)-methyltransferase
MPTLPNDRIAALLTPYLQGATLPQTVIPQLSAYLDLLLKWNARTNLTAIRDPEQIVRRHFGESLFTGLQLLPRLQPGATLLDFGSGAGFPGLPIQLLLPDLHVTLAESQHKKASFLREAVRTLNLATEVWSDRVESIPSTRLFDVITLRAVDRMPEAITAAYTHVAPDGWLITLSTDLVPGATALALPGSAPGWLNLIQAR